MSSETGQGESVPPVSVDLDDRDEAFVETVKDDDYVVISPPAGQEQAFSIWTLLGMLNPWVVLLTAVGLYFLYQRFKPQIEERWSEWSERRQREAETAEIKKNPDLYREKMEAMELARRRMQERYTTESILAAEKAAEREEEKKRQQVEEWENLQQGKGYRNRVKVEAAEFGDGVTRTEDKTKAKKRSTLRPEGNFPLMGGGGGSGGYRPARRNVGGGG